MGSRIGRRKKLLPALSAGVGKLYFIAMALLALIGMAVLLSILSN